MKSNNFWEELSSTLPEFRWMIEKWAPNNLIIIDESLRDKKNSRAIYRLLDHMWWMDIPDDEVNMMKNPKGFNEYLRMLEPDWNFENIESGVGPHVNDLSDEWKKLIN